MSGNTAHVLRGASNATWLVSKAINEVFPEGNLRSPSWAPGRLLKRRERAPMPTGIPRSTLSLCPDCNREAVEAVLKGEIDIANFRENPGVVEAEIVEEAGRILMRKSCKKHGPFEDALSNHPDFFRRMERLAFGRDFECVDDCNVHVHGPNSISSGRGTFLIVDLTNRCNMMCSPCFMDANASSYVHELSIEDIKTIFNNALSFKPQREINILFSGGEPTVSPIFLDAVRHAKGMGFHRLHVATNGVHFAENRDFALQAKEAGLHAVYLQLDGVSEEKNKHRGLGNYMAVKQQALENIAAAGMRTTLQVTVTNSVNNDGLGDIVGFAIQNIHKIHGVVFQPIMFAGRDERVSPDERYARRYPLTQLAFDLHEQTSIGWQPMRDWFPLSDFGIFAHLCDVLNPEAKVGSLFQETHPNRGIFSPLLVDTQQKAATPIPTFFDLEQFMRDTVEITDSGRGPTATRILVSLSIVRNFNQQKAPSGFGLGELRPLLEDCFYRLAGSSKHWSQKAYSYGGRWRVMIVNGMWFQDAFNYDFSGICNSTTPVATTQGEISFCAYYGGGWRKVVEHQSRTATLAEWHRTYGRHEIYANGKNVDLGQPAQGAGTQLVQIEPEPPAVPTAVVGHCD
ncbi:MAG: radical SAM protein [Acidobacteria bacterium]|jgi:tetraether lipid synthase|nr:MAG: radical SAM protein [Acidobacteriota bacterium]PYT47110.1 MAG: radical SAM protein [Acidobacteriota bacterium]